MTHASLESEIFSATAVLTEAGIDSGEVDAVLLAAYLLGCDAGEVRRRMILREAVDDDFRERFATLIAERADRIPLQHLTGVAHFRRLTLRVGPGVFVPRPETEVVAGVVIAAATQSAAPVVIDLCTGSGAIALAVKDEVPAARVVAVELDPLATEWARANREALGLDVEIIHGDARTERPVAEGTADIVVSNPPYIPVGMEPVDPEVRDHDPDLALYGGSSDGLLIPIQVAQNAAGLLRPGGLLVMEHADSQGETLPARLRDDDRWDSVADHPDLTGRPRFVTAVRR